jgi:hypothetical protein
MVWVLGNTFNTLFVFMLLFKVFESKDIESKIFCSGINVKCKTKKGEGSCEIDLPSYPSHPTTCMIQNACITRPSTIELYTNSTLNVAFNGRRISTDSRAKSSDIDMLPMHLEVRHNLVMSQENIFFDPIAGSIIGSHNYRNFGHVLGDVIWPVFRMMNSFSAENDEFQLLLRIQSLAEFVSSNKTVMKFVNAVTDRHILLHDDDHSFTKKCFKRLFVGSSEMSYALGKYQDARALMQFRNFVLNRMKLNSVHKNDHPVILIILKHVESSEHKCSLGDVPQIIEYFTTHFPHSRVLHMSWNGMPLIKQVQTMQQSDIVISLPGSDLMNAIFLKDKSTIFVPCRKVGANLEFSNEVRIWFISESFLSTIELCGDEDITFTKGIASINIISLAKYMPSAIHDWYNHNNLTSPY